VCSGIAAKRRAKLGIFGGVEVRILQMLCIDIRRISIQSALQASKKRRSEPSAAINNHLLLLSAASARRNLLKIQWCNLCAFRCNQDYIIILFGNHKKSENTVWLLSLVCLPALPPQVPAHTCPACCAYKHNQRNHRYIIAKAHIKCFAGYRVYLLPDG
jgi:hypothetical protein